MKLIKLAKKSLILAAIILVIKANNAYALSIVGDFNKDNSVDMKDIAEIGSYYDSNNTTYDLNKDGIVDIFDIVKTSKNMSDANYIVYNGEGIVSAEYNSGELLSACKMAANNNGILVKNGQVIWTNTTYSAFDGENYILKSDKYFNAGIAAASLNSGIVIAKDGNTVLNKENNYKIKLAYAQDDLNLRNSASETAPWSSEIPKGSLVELIKRTNGVYQVNYNDGKLIKRGYVTRYVDIFTDDFNDDLLGYVSEKYESNGKPGTYNTTPGDPGGTSYGPWQLAVKVGSVDSFLMWLKGEKVDFYNTLISAKQADNGTYGTNFNNAWSKLGTDHYDEFFDVQKKYIKITYFDQLVKALKNSGTDYSSRLNDYSVRNMLWSTAVQHGVGGAKNIIQIYKDVTNDVDFINAIYDERSKVDIYFKSSSDAVKQGVKNRFVSEKQFIQRILSAEKNY
ncbi:hypothetical protein JHL18_25015 [Clostridium sp. YIM B02505]|uniref:Type VI secretion system spike protein VgrG3-like C-terminal domain-containing protein n=1 Tax=Clostridium yunnanense TaxID=2800325 RepID=A0ABS1EWW9_9CLOT|nr:hypothetical protein [Clostridium yunnanense]MBK1813871.1 hypothetical protein [Clostridium yunnanense]